MSSVTTRPEITSFCQYKRMIPSSSNLSDSLTSQVFDMLRTRLVRCWSESKLAVSPKPEWEQWPIFHQHEWMSATSSNILYNKCFSHVHIECIGVPEVRCLILWHHHILAFRWEFDKFRFSCVQEFSIAALTVVASTKCVEVILRGEGEGVKPATGDFNNTFLCK